MWPLPLRAATLDFRGRLDALTRTDFAFAGFAALDFGEVDEREEDGLEPEELDPFCAARSNGNRMARINVRQRTARFIMEMFS